MSSNPGSIDTFRDELKRKFSMHLSRENQPDRLNQAHFLAVIGLALLLHVLALVIWHVMPHTQVVDIPVHALNVKLGDGDATTQEEEQAIQAEAANGMAVENALTHAVRDDDAAVHSMDKAMSAPDRTASAKALDKSLAGSAPAVVQESARKLADIARQFVRENTGSKATGSTLGNSDAKNAEMISRYEQLISLWIQKFKLYPDEAKAQGMQGETVVRIRIDRQGNIRYYILERSTGYQLLDRAAIDMIKRANPVPAVPNDYPQGDLIEFLIPVNFHLK